MVLDLNLVDGAEHAKPLLKQMHGLPTEQRIKYNLKGAVGYTKFSPVIEWKTWNC